MNVKVLAEAIEHVGIASTRRIISPCDILCRRNPSVWSTVMSARIAAGNVRLKRAYEQPGADDGTRILIDRLWPRGVKKADAAVDRWVKELAPSTELRKWFG